VITWVWEPKFTTRDGAFYKYVVNNWRLSSLTTMQAGRPYSVNVNVLDTPAGRKVLAQHSGDSMLFRGRPDLRVVEWKLIFDDAPRSFQNNLGSQGHDPPRADILL
jgi:hypothetical protein